MVFYEKKIVESLLASGSEKKNGEEEMMAAWKR